MTSLTSCWLLLLLFNTIWMSITEAGCLVGTAHQGSLSSMGDEHDGCPSSCRCETKTVDDVTGIVVDCSSRGLRKIPQYLPTSTIELLISNNYLNNVSRQDFERCYELRTLDLSLNGVNSVEDGSFTTNINLKELFLNSNQLIYVKLPTGLFDELIKLEDLRLDNNTWQSTRNNYNDILYRNLSNLRSLAIDGIKDVVFGKWFSGLRKLEAMTICGGLNIVRNETLASLSQSPIRTLTFRTSSHLYALEPMSFGHFPSLETLDLSYNQGLGIQNVSDAWYGLNFTNITKLILTRIIPPDSQSNQVTEKFFNYLNWTRIDTLLIDKNNIVNFEPRLNKDLPYLRHFNMAYNRLSNVGSVVLDLWKLKHLEYYDCSHQSKRYVQPESGMQHGRDAKRGSSSDNGNTVEDCRTPKLQPCLKEILKMSSGVDLDDDGFGRDFPLPDHGPWCVPLGPRLQTANLTESLNADLTDVPAVVFFGGTHVRRLEYRSNGFTSLRGPLIFSMATHDLALDFTDNRLRCFSPDTFNFSVGSGSGITEILFSGNEFAGQLERDSSGEMFRQFANLTILALDRNGIATLPPAIFSHLHSLKTLNLSRNFLRLVDFDFSHLHRLELLDVSYNLLTSLDDTVSSKLSRMMNGRLVNQTRLAVNLLGNPVQCTCESLRFLEWLEDNRKQLVDFDSYSCIFRGSMVQFVNLTDVVLVELRFECSKPLVMIIAGSLLAFLILVLSVSVCCYRFRWEIRYCCLRLTQRGKLYQLIIDERTQYKYDAFVVYHHGDGEWVTDELIPNLEGPDDNDDDDDGRNIDDDSNDVPMDLGRLRLCVHERDFPLGEVIIDNIYSRIDSSRKTILIISQNFLTSSYCNYELQLARMLSVQKGRNLILPVMLETIAMDRMSESLRWIARKLTYLEWPGNACDRADFWQRLRDAVMDIDCVALDVGRQ